MPAHRLAAIQQLANSHIFHVVIASELIFLQQKWKRFHKFRP